MKPNLSISIGKLKLKNPVLVASGTFGYGEEFEDFINLKELGAIVTKTITLKPRQGNFPPRTCETPAGMLNSIGLENPGLDVFIKEKVPYLARIGVPLIVSIASEYDPGEFLSVSRRLDKIRAVCAIELNISCPNLKNKKLIAQDPAATYRLVSKVRRVTGKALITKLSPNVTCITDIASAAEKAGSDALSLINTLGGMSIDTRARKPKLASICGGLSGPSIRPVALKMVWEVYQKTELPIIGMGGIIDTPSALEFFIAGASAVAVGTANFVNPGIVPEIIRGLKEYCRGHKINSIKELTGSLRCQD
ncbi:MAG: dihydroorotate dehydrogenase [Candidatus Omnitrophica bacterium]|nr:dihydroorotate dehydrogenase [Candidatus Omnitrophota bacterium]